MGQDEGVSRDDDGGTQDFSGMRDAFVHATEGDNVVSEWAQLGVEQDCDQAFLIAFVVRAHGDDGVPEIHHGLRGIERDSGVIVGRRGFTHTADGETERLRGRHGTCRKPRLSEPGLHLS